jgi:two-component system cell cycle sensor histidine kinase/response regulator CckA
LVPRDTSTPPRASERTALACASATTFLGGLGLLGWVTPWRALASIYPGSIPMAPSTALALLLLGATLILEARRPSPRLTTAVSLLVLIFGGVPTGRISPLTALGLLLASLSLLFIGLASGHRALGAVGGSLAFAVGLLGFVVTLGYLFGAPLLYGGSVVPMPFPTALAVGCLGLALLGLTPRNSDRAASRTGMDSPQDPGVEYSLLFAANPIAMWVFDTETLQFLEVNEAAVAKYGFSRGEFLGMTIADIRPPEDVPALAAAVKAPTATVLRGPAPWRHRRKDGTLLNVQITAQDIVFKERRARLVLAQDLSEGERSRRDADLAAIVQSSSDAIYSTSLDGAIIAWNASAERLFGHAQDEALGRSAHMLVPPGGEDERTEILERISAGESIEQREMNLVRKDGSQVLVSLSASPLRDAEGHVVGVSVIARDVSEQRRAEKALLESETKLRALFESDLVGILFGDVHGGIQDANEKFLRMVGYTRDDLRAGLRWSALTAAEFRPLDAAGIAEARERGACVPFEKQYIRKDGRRLWVLVGYVLLEPERERSVAFVLDIDARKQAEDELRRSEVRFASVFESSLIALGIAETSSGRLIDVNNRCAEFFGYARDEMIGRTVFELGLWADPADRERHIAGISAGGSTSSMETAFRRKSGEIRHALVSMEAMTLARIAEPLIMVTLVDLTERKQLESQLLQAQKMEAVGRLAGGVAHDFNNSLGVILGHTELLLRQASEAQRGKLEQILKATQRASGLTRQLLAFSRKQIVDPKVLDLNVLLSELEKMLGRLIGEDIDLAIVPGEDLGQVKADPGQLEQVVMNLCVNARDAMPDGGLLRIETANAELDPGHAARHEPLAPGRYVKLAVSDTGCGIEKGILSKIFEPFFTTKEPGKGTGLGLAMVYGIVKQAGGYVWVYSEVGRGTTFKIYLPRVDEPAVAPEVQETPMPSKGWETILLVEDEGSLRAIAREILEDHGYRVIEAGGANEAIEIARRHPEPIHLLVTDVVMPGMNGRALAESLVAARPELRVLYISGYTDDVIAHSGVLESGTLLLEKPFTTLALLGRVRTALGARGTGENA